MLCTAAPQVHNWHHVAHLPTLLTCHCLNLNLCAMPDSLPDAWMHSASHANNGIGRMWINAMLCLMRGGVQCTTAYQMDVARALGVPAHKVVCRTKRVGGGFGGKESRFIPATCAGARKLPASTCRRLCCTVSAWMCALLVGAFWYTAHAGLVLERCRYFLT